MAERQFKLREMRDRARLSQQQVADSLGIPKGRYGDWERETTTLNLKDAIGLADLFGCTLDELAGHEVRVPDHPVISADEHSIIDTYRAAGRLGKRVILATTREVAEDLELKAREKKVGNQAG